MVATLLGIDQRTAGGCSPYGASTIAGRNGEKTPNQVLLPFTLTPSGFESLAAQVELDGARFQGEHVAKITRDLVVGRNAAKK